MHPPVADVISAVDSDESADMPAIVTVTQAIVMILPVTRLVGGSASVGTHVL